MTPPGNRRVDTFDGFDEFPESPTPGEMLQWYHRRDVQITALFRAIDEELEQRNTPIRLVDIDEPADTRYDGRRSFNGLAANRSLDTIEEPWATRIPRYVQATFDMHPEDTVHTPFNDSYLCVLAHMHKPDIIVALNLNPAHDAPSPEAIAEHSMEITDFCRDNGYLLLTSAASVNHPWWDREPYLIAAPRRIYKVLSEPGMLGEEETGTARLMLGRLYDGAGHGSGRLQSTLIEDLLELKESYTEWFL